MKTTVVQKGSNKPMSVMKLTQMAMLIAISVVLVLLIKFPIFPSASFLEYDMADVPVLIGTMMFGAPAGMVILLITSVIQAFLLGGKRMGRTSDAFSGFRRACGYFRRNIRTF